MIWRALRNIEEKYDLDFVGSYGEILYNVKILIAFRSYSPMKVDRARELVVACTEEFLKYINESEELRQYVDVYSSTVKDVGVIIYGTDENFSQIYIACVFLSRGNIQYYVNTRRSFKLIHEETYEEGLEIVKQESTLRNKTS